MAFNSRTNEDQIPQSKEVSVNDDFEETFKRLINPVLETVAVSCNNTQLARIYLMEKILDDRTDPDIKERCIAIIKKPDNEINQCTMELFS